VVSGHAQNEWKLVPSAHRRHPVLESQFAHHFRLRAPSLAANCPEHKDYVSWLPLMQHYGLPTRLLDWTESLLVAAFFAIPSKSTPSSAALWLLAPGTLNEQSIGRLIPFLVDDRVTPLVAAAFSGRINPEEENSVAVLVRLVLIDAWLLNSVTTLFMVVVIHLKLTQHRHNFSREFSFQPRHMAKSKPIFRFLACGSRQFFPTSPVLQWNSLR
jgi:hypothetical protein